MDDAWNDDVRIDAEHAAGVLNQMAEDRWGPGQ
jgi:hypothetical protein